MSKTALVTGGAKRIGRAISLALAERGYDVAVHYHSSSDPAEQLAAEIRKLGRRCEPLQCDLSDTAAAGGLVGRARNALGGLGLLINNASIFPRGRFAATDEPLLDRAMAVNFKAPFFLSQRFAERCEDGQIINLLDTRITRSRHNYFAYSLSKKLLAELTRMTARELAPNVRVNGVCPGLILPAEGEDDETFERLAEQVPLKHRGGPENIVRAVMYLVDSEFVTGQFLFVDGGEHLL